MYRVLHAHLATFVDACEEEGARVSRHARRELEDYLLCGVPEYGFALLRCAGCDTARVVAFSCKRRGFCPSCTGRRMSQGAAHLVERVFPRVPVRQWVLSLPMPLRFRLAWDVALCREVLAVFLAEVFAHLRGATGIEDGRCGSVTLEQTFGSALNANLHFHVLVADGAWSKEEAVFHAAPVLATEEVQRVVDRVRAGVEALLARRGLLDDEGELAAEEDEDAERLLLAASVAGRAALGERAGAMPRWMRQKRVRQLPERCAAAGYFNLHAAVRIGAQDREALERLCRYVQRPPLSHERLTEQADGRLFLKFKRGWDDGTVGVLLTPHQLIARLAAIIPQPRRNLVHDHGVFAPAARGRSEIVPAPPSRSTECVRLLPRHARRSSGDTPWIPWSELLRRVFAVDALVCPGCGGRMEVHAVVQGRWAPGRVLGTLGRPSSTPRLWLARGPPAVG